MVMPLSRARDGSLPVLVQSPDEFVELVRLNTHFIKIVALKPGESVEV